MQLPIRMRISESRAGWAPVVLIVIIVAFGLVIYIGDHDLRMFLADGECKSKHGRLLSGNNCIPVLLMPVFFLSSLVWLAGIAYETVRVVSRRARFEGYDLLITEDEFWHVQLARPIRFKEISAVKVTYRTSHLYKVVLVCETPPQLAFWSLNNLSTWNRTLSAFTFEPTLFFDPSWSAINDKFAPVLATIEFLVNRKKA